MERKSWGKRREWVKGCVQVTVLICRPVRQGCQVCECITCTAWTHRHITFIPSSRPFYHFFSFLPHTKAFYPSRYFFSIHISLFPSHSSFFPGRGLTTSSKDSRKKQNTKSFPFPSPRSLPFPQNNAPQANLIMAKKAFWDTDLPFHQSKESCT